MFSLSESTRTPAIWKWIAHYLLAVPVPLWMLEFANGMIGIGDSRGTAGQVLVEYALLGGFGVFVGVAAYLAHPLTASVARKTWIFPVCLFVISFCWDFWLTEIDKRNTVSSYIVFLPGNTIDSESWDTYFFITFPAVAAASYALGSRIGENLVSKHFRVTANRTLL